MEDFTGTGTGTVHAYSIENSNLFLIIENTLT